VFVCVQVYVNIPKLSTRVEDWLLYPPTTPASVCSDTRYATRHCGGPLLSSNTRYATCHSGGRLLSSNTTYATRHCGGPLCDEGGVTHVTLNKLLMACLSDLIMVDFELYDIIMSVYCSYLCYHLLFSNTFFNKLSSGNSTQKI